MTASTDPQLLEENAQLREQIADLENTGRRTELRLSELDHLYRTAPIGLCFMDNDLRFVRINDRLAAINGHAAEDHLGKHLREVIPDIAEMVEPIYRRVIESGNPELDFEVVGATSASPVERSYRVSYYPVKDDGGKVVRKCY